mgnify:CR=1 FL=1
MPVKDPDEGWVDFTLKKKTEFEASAAAKVRLIVVNDGSNSRVYFDQIQQRDSSIEVVHLAQNKGKGNALREGLKRCISDTILFTDADFPYTVDSMQKVAEALRNGADVALGYREQDYYASVPWFRTVLSESFRFMLQRVLKFPVTDTQCGLKGMTAKGKDVFLQTRINRFLVDMEFIKLASKNRVLVIEPVVVVLRPNVVFSKMGFSVLIAELYNFVKVLFR